MQRTPNLAISLGQSLYRLKAIVIIKINLKGAANTIVQHKWPQDSRRKANTAAINTVRKNGFNAAFI